MRRGFVAALLGGDGRRDGTPVIAKDDLGHVRLKVSCIAEAHRSSTAR
jgi:hypothetical protein